MFIFSNFAGLQAYSQQLYYQMNSFPGVIWQHFKSPMLSPCIDLSPPPPYQILKSPPTPIRGGGHSRPMFSTSMETLGVKVPEK